MTRIELAIVNIDERKLRRVASRRFMRRIKKLVFVHRFQKRVDAAVQHTVRNSTMLKMMRKWAEEKGLIKDGYVEQTFHGTITVGTDPSVPSHIIAYKS